MIKATICDDEKYFVDELHLRLKEFFLDKRVEFRISEYLSGKSLLEHGASDCDLLFLDVKMEDQDGFKTAEQLRRSGFAGCLVFSTIMNTGRLSMARLIILSSHFPGIPLSILWSALFGRSQQIKTGSSFRAEVKKAL